MIELKFKEKGQKVEWEALPVILRASEEEIAIGIAWLRRMFVCIEIRWNYEGRGIGHYVDGNRDIK